jgi:leucyl aminopeptidase
MELSTGVRSIYNPDTPALIKFCTVTALRTDPIIRELDKASDRLITRVYENREFAGEEDQSIVFYNFPGVSAEKLILVGLGESKKPRHEKYRQAAGLMSALPALRRSRSAAVYLNNREDAGLGQAIVEGFKLARFRMTAYKSNNDDKPITESLGIYIADRRRLPKLRKAVGHGEVIADGVILARSLTAHPGNFLTPRKFADEIKTLAKEYSFEVDILDEKKIRAEKMGAFLAVARGSDQPPRFAIMRYRGGRAKARPVVLVGKGITFDSGGISLKVPKDMGEMKGDMQGAAVVTGAIVTAARLKLPLNIVGLIPMAENLPSGKALKPGDIITSRKGKTIEIINTDAEGRLILADALDYADKFDPQAVFDIATLTGAAKYILGTGGIPIMGNNKKAIQALYRASLNSGERVWELPLWEDYHKRMKSPIADLQNSGGPEAGTLTAAAFLEEFIGNWPWTHIDIAAVDVEKEGQAYIPKGVTGRGMRLMVDLLLNWRRL